MGLLVNQRLRLYLTMKTEGVNGYELEWGLFMR
jgi:hypothetical protein